MKLYEVDKKLEDLITLAIDEETGEIVDEKAMAELEAMELDKKDKLLDIGCVVRGCNKEIDVINDEIKRLQSRKQSLENKRDFLKKLIFTNMSEKIKDHRVSIYTSKSKSVNIINEDKITSNYLKVTVTPKKTEIKKAILGGETVLGCELIEKESVVVR